jgi:5-oxoprolinase (ATP-hydrolysing)/N-methylhydantoinase A
VEATLPSGTLSDESLAAITSSFEAAYRMLYHRLPQGVPIEALNWRVTTAGPAPHVTMHPAATAGGGARGALKGTRRAWFPEADAYVDTPVYDRYALEPGAELSGPAIVEERESTSVLPPGTSAAVDEYANLLVTLDTETADAT